MKKTFLQVFLITLTLNNTNIFAHSIQDFEITTQLYDRNLKLRLVRNKNFEAISTSRLCSVETRTDDAYIYIHTFIPDKSECKKLICANELSQLIPLEEIIYNWMTQKKKYTLYATNNGNSMPRSIFRCLTGKCIFKGAVLLEEYKKHIPMWWKLQSIAELKDIIHYFNEQMVLHNVIPKKDNLLFISVEEDPFIPSVEEDEDEKKLNESEMDFLETYFNVVENKRIIKNCHIFHRTMMLNLSKIEAMNYPLITSSLRENLAEKVELGYKSIGFKDIILLAITTVLIRSISTATDLLNKSLNNFFQNSSHKKHRKTHKKKRSSKKKAVHESSSNEDYSSNTDSDE